MWLMMEALVIYLLPVVPVCVKHFLGPSSIPVKSDTGTGSSVKIIEKLNLTENRYRTGTGRQIICLLLISLREKTRKDVPNNDILFR
jgi:hypothetical protein